MEGNLALRSNQIFNVLLIEPDSNNSDNYRTLIARVAVCDIGLATGAGDLIGVISRTKYHLIVINSGIFNTDGNKGNFSFKGLGLLEQVKQISPATSVIYISDTPSISEAVSAIRIGAEDYFELPLNPDLFKLAIKRALDRSMIFGKQPVVSGLLNLLNSCQMVSATLEQSTIFEIIKSYLSVELGADFCEIYKFKDKELIRVEKSNSSRHQNSGEVSLVERVAPDFLSQMSNNNENYMFFSETVTSPGFFAFRFFCADEDEFCCLCISPQKPLIIKHFENRISILKTQVEFAGKNISQYHGVKTLVYVDELTGLYNTRYLHSLLEREIVRSQKTRKSFALLFVDVDKFKNINDKHGHQVGSDLLVDLSLEIKKQIRETDNVVRYGGDEFIAILSQCDLETAGVVAERIRSSIENKKFPISKNTFSVRMTVSIGVALFPDDAKTEQDVIKAADMAMYLAKKRRRNCVEFASTQKEKGFFNKFKKQKIKSELNNFEAENKLGI